MNPFSLFSIYIQIFSHSFVSFTQTQICIFFDSNPTHNKEDFSLFMRLGKGSSIFILLHRSFPTLINNIFLSIVAHDNEKNFSDDMQVIFIHRENQFISDVFMYQVFMHISHHYRKAEN